MAFKSQSQSQSSNAPQVQDEEEDSFINALHKQTQTINWLKAKELADFRIYFGITKVTKRNAPNNNGQQWICEIVLCEDDMKALEIKGKVAFSLSAGSRDEFMLGLTARLPQYNVYLEEITLESGSPFFKFSQLRKSHPDYKTPPVVTSETGGKTLSLAEKLMARGRRPIESRIQNGKKTSDTEDAADVFNLPSNPGE